MRIKALALKALAEVHVVTSLCKDKITNGTGVECIRSLSSSCGSPDRACCYEVWTEREFIRQNEFAPPCVLRDAIFPAVYLLSGRDARGEGLPPSPHLEALSGRPCQRHLHRKTCNPRLAIPAQEAIPNMDKYVSQG